MLNIKFFKKNRFMIFLLFCINSFAQNMVQRTDVKTPKNTTVPDAYECISGDLTQAEKNQWKADFESTYPNATFLDHATYTYNCHSFAWNTTEGGLFRWVGYSTATAENIYWNDGSYIQVDNAYQGEKVSYPESANHSAIETTDLSNEVYDSKWGAYVLARHSRNYCPYSPLSPVKYYARYVRNLSNITIASSIDRRYAAKGTFSISNTTINNGAKVDIVSDDKVDINSITIQDGSTVNISVY